MAKPTVASLDSNLAAMIFTSGIAIATFYACVVVAALYSVWG